jgi:hypothetical protein
VIHSGLAIRGTLKPHRSHFYRYTVTSLANDVSLTVTPLRGDADLLVAMTPIYHPSPENYTWASVSYDCMFHNSGCNVKRFMLRRRRIGGKIRSPSKQASWQSYALAMKRTSSPATSSCRCSRPSTRRTHLWQLFLTASAVLSR